MPRYCSCSRVGGPDPHSAIDRKYLDKEQRTFFFIFLCFWPVYFHLKRLNDFLFVIRGKLLLNIRVSQKTLFFKFCFYLLTSGAYRWGEPPKKFRALLAFSRAKKWHFERPNLRTESKNLAKHPPKWLGRHLGHAFPFSGEYQANHVFRAVRSSFYTLKRPKNENGSYFFVYGSIILKFFLVALLTYTHHWLTAISKI